MVNRHDQDTPRGAGAGFVLGLLVGTALGAAIGLLVAPRLGSDLRDDIRHRARDLGQKAADRYRDVGDKAGDLVDQGRETVKRVRSAAASGVEEVRRFAARAKGEKATSDPTDADPSLES